MYITRLLTTHIAYGVVATQCSVLQETTLSLASRSRRMSDHVQAIQHILCGSFSGTCTWKGQAESRLWTLHLERANLQGKVNPARCNRQVRVLMPLQAIGSPSRRLLEHPNLEVVAVDPNEEMIAALRRNLPEATAVKGSATEIPAAANSLDAIFVAQVRLLTGAFMVPSSWAAVSK